MEFQKSRAPSALSRRIDPRSFTRNPRMGRCTTWVPIGLDMSKRAFLGLAVGLITMAIGNSTGHAYDVVQVPTERGNVPLYLPSDIQPGEAIPLVVSLHGFTGNGPSHENYFNLRSQIDERRFMLCVPQGSRNSSGDRFWNATDFCCDYEFQNPNDSGYLRDLIDSISDDRPVDEESIHVVGHSNGGFMAYRMACDHADIVASIASLAGATYASSNACVPSEPVHVLQIHGTSDDTIEYGGRCIIPFIFCYPGALDSVSLWSQYNQCSNTSRSLENLDLVGNIGGAETARLVFDEGCADYGSAELWTIEGGSHGPSFNGNYARELVGWLLEHRRPRPKTCVGDIDRNNIVDGADLSGLLSVWGSDSLEADFDEDGIVGGGDLSIVLAAWGRCP